MSLYAFAKKVIGSPTADHYIERLLRPGDCHIALDIGCGSNSQLSKFRPRLKTAGIDAFDKAIEMARAKNLHDYYLVADIMALEPQEILHRFGVKQFDLVTLFDVIEHFPKRQGFELLERCEQLTSKYVMVQTPNGFLEQGPEFNNPYQRHLSGWFQHDFEGLAYTVYGTTGTRLFHGYSGNLRFNFPGALACDALLARLLQSHKHPRCAFNLLAIKDIRGVPARLPS